MYVRGFPSRHGKLVPIFQSLEISPDPVFVTDRLNHVVYWNDAARLLLGFSADEAIGTDCDELLAGCDPFGNRYCSENCPVMQMANRGESVRNFSLTLRGKDGRRLVAAVSLLQLRTEAPDEHFLVHQLRSASVTEMHVSADPEAPPGHVSSRDSTDVRVRKLTNREVEVLAMLAAGRSTPEIAERLHISQLTARSHIQNILEKLEVHSKVEAVAFAFQKNLI